MNEYSMSHPFSRRLWVQALLTCLSMPMRGPDSSCKIQGALGLGETPDSYIPESIEGLPENISGVVAGHYHSLAWDEEGRLFSWGSADQPLSLMSRPCVLASVFLDR